MPIMWGRVTEEMVKALIQACQRSHTMHDPSSTASASLAEHRVPRGGGTLCVRDFAGSGPAFVLLHGFPDNSHIYDDLIPHLTAAGRRTVAFDFLGFGDSDKPEGAAYSFEQQLGDLEAVVEALGLRKVIPSGTTPEDLPPSILRSRTPRARTGCV